MAFPLRAIVARPSQIEEALDCGHVIRRPLGLGEPAQEPSKVQRRRCYKCGDVPPQPRAARKRGAPAQPRTTCPACGRKGLGNTFVATGRGPYKQCRHCGEPAFL